MIVSKIQVPTITTWRTEILDPPKQLNPRLPNSMENITDNLFIINILSINLTMTVDQKIKLKQICWGAIHKLRSQDRGEGGLAKWLRKTT